MSRVTHVNCVTHANTWHIHIHIHIHMHRVTLSSNSANHTREHTTYSSDCECVWGGYGQ